MSSENDHLDAAIAVTGAGLVASLGLDRAEVWRRICLGDSGIGPLTALEQTPLEQKGGAQAPDLVPDASSNQPRESRYLRRAIDQALAQASALESLPYPMHRCGIVLGTTLHGMRAAGRYLREGSVERLRHFLAPAVLAQACGDRGLTGFSATTCSACSSGLAAIGLGVTLLRSGTLDLVLCGGYDPISEYAYAGFNSLRLIAAGSIRPFCNNRDGMKLGEGYALLVLERAEDAQRRSAAPCAYVLGFGESADAHHLTQPHPEGDGAARAMTMALSRAGLSASEVNLVSAHATGTPDNDRGEHAALTRIFGTRLSEVPIVAFKSALGHTLGGAGAVELVMAMTALQEGVIPPTAGASQAALEFADLRMAARAEPAPLRVSLSTSIGFGGANASVVLGRAEALQPARFSSRPRLARRNVVITGIGVVLPGAVGNRAFASRMSNPDVQPVTDDAPPIDDEQLGDLVNARRVRRLSSYVKLSLAATTEACRDAKMDASRNAECSAILGSTHGSANYSSEYYREIVEKGIDAANPMLFAEGVPNAAAAHVSMAFGFKGGCQAIIGTRTAGLDALRLASLRIATGECDRVVISAAEERADTVDQAYASCGQHGGPGSGLPFNGEQGFLTGCGAVTLVLKSEESAQRRGVPAHATIAATASSSSVGRNVSDVIEDGRRVIRALGNPAHVVSSANGTPLDRIELAMLRGTDTVVSSMAGHIAETFSATPLAGIACVLLTGRMPRLLGKGLPPGASARAASGDETPSTIAFICSDFAGLLAGVCLSRNPN